MAIPRAIEQIRSHPHIYSPSHEIDHLWLSAMLTEAWLGAGTTRFSVEKLDSFIIFLIDENHKSKLNLTGSAQYFNPHSTPSGGAFRFEVMIAALAERCIIKENSQLWEVFGDGLREIAECPEPDFAPFTHDGRDFLAFSQALRPIPGYRIR